uniref:Uncharacterized protein n=1 Tax=Chromera velia CCMP2878 TaxID=1169474 RepID=A0A0G4GGU1_9ALVE|eukprot:Cvel_21772.t1-p1 / transcript=Cvel_21772.t1 / gene=Cvel_21772 / organism=Chromera_velia_CCMP2878 / gene_product=hypothetical protein / transcript_product=hypothetical protein / location=Cvel_scaffold2071:21438-31627(+) / protein_length=1149 / sequence_SO=supercontig / SO=protein_coding / is_pseudo=false
MSSQESGGLKAAGYSSTICNNCVQNANSARGATHPSACFCNSGFYFVPDETQSSSDSYAFWTQGKCTPCPENADCFGDILGSSVEQDADTVSRLLTEMENKSGDEKAGQGNLYSGNGVTTSASEVEEEAFAGRRSGNNADSHVETVGRALQTSSDSSTTRTVQVYNLTQHSRPRPQDGFSLIKSYPDAVVVECELETACKQSENQTLYQSEDGGVECGDGMRGMKLFFTVVFCTFIGFMLVGISFCVAESKRRRIEGHSRRYAERESLSEFGGGAGTAEEGEGTGRAGDRRRRRSNSMEAPELVGLTAAERRQLKREADYRIQSQRVLNIWRYNFKFKKGRSRFVTFVSSVMLDCVPVYVIAYVLMFENALEDLIALVKCEPLADGLPRVMSEAPSVRCDSELYTKWVVIVLIVITVMAFVIPSVLAILILRGQRRMGMEPEYVYWEIITIVRKLVVLLVIAYYPGEDPNMRVFSVAIVAVFIVAMQFYVRPYDNRENCALDRLEEHALCVFLYTVICFLFCYIADLPPLTNLAFALLIFVMNVDYLRRNLSIIVLGQAREFYAFILEYKQAEDKEAVVGSRFMVRVWDFAVPIADRVAVPIMRLILRYINLWRVTVPENSPIDNFILRLQNAESEEFVTFPASKIPAHVLSLWSILQDIGEAFFSGGLNSKALSEGLHMDQLEFGVRRLKKMHPAVLEWHWFAFLAVKHRQQMANFTSYWLRHMATQSRALVRQGNWGEDEIMMVLAGQQGEEKFRFKPQILSEAAKFLPAPGSSPKQKEKKQGGEKGLAFQGPSNREEVVRLVEVNFGKTTAQLVRVVVPLNDTFGNLYSVEGDKRRVVVVEEGERMTVWMKIVCPRNGFEIFKLSEKKDVLENGQADAGREEGTEADGDEVAESDADGVSIAFPFPSDRRAMEGGTFDEGIASPFPISHRGGEADLEQPEGEKGDGTRGAYETGPQGHLKVKGTSKGQTEKEVQAASADPEGSEKSSEIRFGPEGYNRLLAASAVGDRQKDEAVDESDSSSEESFLEQFGDLKELLNLARKRVGDEESDGSSAKENDSESSNGEPSPPQGLPGGKPITEEKSVEKVDSEDHEGSEEGDGSEEESVEEVETESEEEEEEEDGHSEESESDKEEEAQAAGRNQGNRRG